MITKMAFRNIGRNRKRTYLSILAISISVMMIAIMQSYVEGIFGGAMDLYVKLQAGHYRILHSSYTAKQRLLPLDLSVYDSEEMDKKVNEWGAVESTSGRIKFGVLLNVNEKNEPCLGIAIDPEKEKGFNDFQDYIIDGDYIRSGTNDIMLGSQLANKLGLKIGDKITIVTSTAYDSFAFKNFKLRGIFEIGAGGLDKKTFYIPLDTAQLLLDMEDSVTELLTQVKDEGDLKGHMKEVDTYLESLEGDYTAFTYKEGNDMVALIQTGKSSVSIIYLILLVISGTTIMNTMLMSVYERTAEIGMMKAMGMKNLKIIYMLLLESTFLGVFAGIIGIIGGGAFSYYFSVNGINFGDFIENVGMTIKNVVYFDFSISYLVFAFVFGLIIAILATLYPALKATALQPTEAMRAK